MTVAITRAAEGLDRRAFTIADLERMVEAGIIGYDERLELLGGEIVPMSPKGSRHEAVKAAIVALWGLVRPKNFMFVPETGLHLDEHTYVEPDFIVFQTTKRLSELKGPDVLLAIEVADSSLNYDLNTKSRVYAAFGVQELWVIDAARRVVHRKVDLSSGHYARSDTRSATDHLMPVYAPAVFGFALDDLEPV